MRNLKITIEYDGTNYAGWQVQKNHRGQKYTTIQETIEQALSQILQEKIRLIASGRTDAGVHALAQVANFKANSKIPLGKLQKALNTLLPNDIVISKAEETSFNFHSRFCAKSKIYRYVILNRNYPSALLRTSTYFYPYPLNINLMRKASRCLLGRHDFKSFCASGSNAKSTVRAIKRIVIKRLPYYLLPITYDLKDSPLIVIDIESDGFLYKMVRNIVGTLIEIGRGEFSRGSLKKILAAKDRKMAGPAAPARGLLLVKVKY